MYHILVYICVFFFTKQDGPSHYVKKLTHIIYYEYQQRSLRRWVWTRNSSNSRLTSLNYFYKILSIKSPIIIQVRTYFACVTRILWQKHQCISTPYTTHLVRPKEQVIRYRCWLATRQQITCTWYKVFFQAPPTYDTNAIECTTYCTAVV